MSDKEIILDAIRRLPESATMKQIRERVEFIAAIDEGEKSLDRGEGVSQQEAEKRYEAWIFRNPKTLASIKRGLKESGKGKVKSLGSFAKYAK